MYVEKGDTWGRDWICAGWLSEGNGVKRGDLQVAVWFERFLFPQNQ